VSEQLKEGAPTNQTLAHFFTRSTKISGLKIVSFLDNEDPVQKSPPHLSTANMGLAAPKKYAMSLSLFALPY
jgi:hypothetical protein